MFAEERLNVQSLRENHAEILLLLSKANDAKNTRRQDNKYGCDMLCKSHSFTSRYNLLFLFLKRRYLFIPVRLQETVMKNRIRVNAMPRNVSTQVQMIFLF